MTNPTDDLPLTKTIDLAKPITFDGKEFAQIVLREPKAKEILQADQQIQHGVNAWTLRNRQLHLVSKVSGLPFPVIEQIPVSALIRSMAYLDRFLDLGQETGEN